MCGQAKQQTLTRDRNTGAQEEGTAVKQVNRAKRPGRETEKQASQHICWVATFLGKTSANTDDVVPVGTAKELPLLVIFTPLHVTIPVRVIRLPPSSSIQIKWNE